MAMEHKDKFTLETLSSFIEDSESWIDDTLQRFNWTKERLFQQDEELQVCPEDAGHQMPECAMRKHSSYCHLFKKGYNKQEVEELLAGISNPDPRAIRMNENIFQDILTKGRDSRYIVKKSMPLTAERACIELNVYERLALYDYCVETSKGSMDNLSIEDFMLLQTGEASGDKNNPKSFMEQLAERRDMKRRRQTYRAKNVHTTQKSHTEVIREVLNNQMKFLEEVWSQEAKTKKAGEKPSDLKSYDECQRSSPLPHHDDHEGQSSSQQSASHPVSSGVDSPSPTCLRNLLSKPEANVLRKDSVGRKRRFRESKNSSSDVDRMSSEEHDGDVGNSEDHRQESPRERSSAHKKHKKHKHHKGHKKHKHKKD